MTASLREMSTSRAILPIRQLSMSTTAGKRVAQERNSRAVVDGAQAPATALPGAKQQNEGHGRRLTAAFEALEAFPALAESRKRVLRLVSQEHELTLGIVI